MPSDYAVKQLRAFAKLTRQDHRLLLNAFVTLAICRARLLTQNIEKLQAWATSTWTGNAAISVERLAWAVEIASRKMPGATCFCRALTLQRLLAKHGYGSELKIGVGKNNDQFAAHAWLVHASQVLIGDSQLGKYELLIAWQHKTELSESREHGAARI
jgi:Transglutaminase-like superfamily